MFHSRFTILGLTFEQKCKSKFFSVRIFQRIAPVCQFSPNKMDNQISILCWELISNPQHLLLLVMLIPWWKKWNCLQISLFYYGSFLLLTLSEKNLWYYSWNTMIRGNLARICERFFRDINCILKMIHFLLSRHWVRNFFCRHIFFYFLRKKTKDGATIEKQ